MLLLILLLLVPLSFHYIHAVDQMVGLFCLSNIQNTASNRKSSKETCHTLLASITVSDA